MSILKIVLCSMFFASASVAVTREDLLEDAKLAALNPMNSTKLRVRINSKPILVVDAKKKIEKMNTEYRYFVKSIRNETSKLLSRVSTVFIEPASLNNVSTSECDRLRLGLLDSANAAVTRGHNCTTFRVKTIKRLIKKIDRLTHIIVNVTTNTQSTINSHVGVYSEPTIKTIAMVKAGMSPMTLPLKVHKYLRKLNRTNDELEGFLLLNQVNHCLKTTDEYSIYKNLLSTFYTRTGECIDIVEAKARTAKSIADGMRTMDELSEDALNKLFEEKP